MCELSKGMGSQRTWISNLSFSWTIFVTAQWWRKWPCLCFK